jgi:DNA-binding response OmpR family regulator
MDRRQTAILFGDSEQGWSRPLRAKLRKRGFRVSATRSARSLLESVEREFPDIVVLDEDLEAGGGGILISIIRSRSPKTRIIRLFPARASSPGGVWAGHEDLPSFTKPVPVELLWEAILSAVRRPVDPGSRKSSPLILCVDDDRATLRSLSRILERHGYRVLTYTGAERALQELPLLDPDLLVLDVLMPGMNGLELIDELREYRQRSVPVVLLSGWDSDDAVQAGYGHGAACYLTKPLVPEILLDVVERLLRPAALLPRGAGG